MLSVYATLPNGSTLEQMNVLIKRMETYLSDFKELGSFRRISIMRVRLIFRFILQKKISGADSRIL